jgi:acyl carrier protein
MPILTSEKHKQLLGVLRQAVGQSDLHFSESTELKSLSIDSLGMLDLMITLEDQADCQIDPEKLAVCLTVGDVIRLIEAGQ